MVTLNIEIDEQELRFDIPSSWEDVTVEKFSNIWKIDVKNLTQIEYTVKMVNHFTDIEEDILYMMSPEQFEQVAKTIEFTSVDVIGSKKDSIIIDGEEWFLKKDYDKLNMGEVVSLQIIMEQAKGNLSTKFAEMLCIFLRKKLPSGKLESFKNSFMEERVDIFKKASIADVNDLLLFFSGGVTLSNSNTQVSTENV